MPTIEEMNYGYYASGVSSYLEEIKSTVLTKAQEAVIDTKQIETVCESKWSGKSKDAFLSNLKKDASHVSEQLGALYSVLQDEVYAVQAAMANKDEELIKES